MNVSFYGVTTLLLIILQTVVLPLFQGPRGGCFDLMLILVLHLSLAYTHYMTVVGLLAMGLLMDSISGAPYFIYTFSYLWVYFIVKLFRQLVFQKSVVFVFVVGMISVVIQEGLMLFSVVINSGPGAVSWQMGMGVLVRQVVFGALVIPPGVWCVNQAHAMWHAWIKQFKKQMAKRLG
ncbi:MAG: hypothetical protein MI747_01825 [Desulfobacterales bacterium]|nr:hypothetical protein [Desulfobacterales bacterium]